MFDADDIPRFLETAARGKHGAASTGEQSAYKLAKQAEKVSALLQDVDAGLKNGFYSLLAALAHPDLRAQWLKKLPR